MERIVYDAAWLDAMRQKEDVMSYARIFREHSEEDSLRVRLETECRAEDVVWRLDDAERRTRIAFEDTLVATGLIKRAKVAFEGFVFRREEREEKGTAISVWLVPSVPWEAFAYWAEDGESKRSGVLVALAYALRAAFGVDASSQFFARQLDTLGEMLALAHDFPFLMSELGHTDICEIDAFDGAAVFFDIIRHCNCTLEPCSLDFYDKDDPPHGILGSTMWQFLINMACCGYSRSQKQFFKDERSIAEDYKAVERSLDVFRSSPRGGKKYVVDFEVFALRPSFAFIADPEQTDRVATLERGLVSSGFCHRASFSLETLLGNVLDGHCVVRAVVDAPDRYVAVDMPFAFHKAIVDTFQQTCGCCVVELRQHGFPGASLLFGEDEEF